MLGDIPVMNSHVIPTVELKNDDNKGIYKNIFHKVGNNTGVSLNTIHGVNKQYCIKAK